MISTRRTFFSMRWFLIAVSAVAVAGLLTWPLASLVPYRIVLPIYFLAVMISAWHGGIRGGLLATLLSALLADYLLIPPVGTLAGDREHIETFIVFAFVCLAIVGLTEARNRNERRRRKTVEALRASDERFHAAFSNAVAGFAITDLEGHFLEANRAYCEIVGYTREELRALNYDCLTHPDDIPGAISRLQSLLAGDIPAFVMEKRYIRKDKTIVWVQNTVSLMRDSEERPTNVVRLTEDITERKQAEERLCEYERVVEGLEEMIVVVDREYRYLIANRVFLNQRGLKREEIVGHLVPEVIDKDVFERVVKPKLDECFQGKVVRYEMDYSYPEIGERVLSISYFPIEGPHGVDRVACVLQDITERKQAEETLRQTEQKYRDIFENAGEGISQSTPDGRFIAANPALARMYGFASPEELIHSLRDISRQLYVDPTRREEFKRQLEQQDAVRGFEYQVFRKDGSKIWISVNARAVHDARGAILYYEGTARDINERKRAEARSAAFATLARKLSGARTQLEAGRIIAQTADDLFGWDSCNLDLYDAERDLVHPMLDVDTIGGKRTDFTASLSDRTPTARGKRVIDNGPELVLREEPIQFDEDSIPFGDKSRPSASIMTVPIRHAARVIGLLSIQSYTSRAYDAAALGDFQALADHCGEALNRIRAEEELRESEERYRDLVENSRELICTHDLDGRVLSANRAAAETLGYDSNELMEGKNIRDILAPEVRHQFDEYMARLCKDGATSGIMLVQTISGERRVWEYYNSLRTEGVAAPVVRGMARDITERKRAEEKVQSLARFPSENPSPVLRLGRDGMILHANSTSRLLLQDWGCSVGDRAPLFWQQEASEALASQTNRTIDVVCGDITYSIFVAPIVEADYVNLYGRDITERQQIEEELRESEERYRDLVENSREFICTHDLNGVILSANRAAAEVLGYDLEDCCGKKNYRDLLVPEVRDQFDDYLARIRRDGVASGLTLVQTSSGERRLWEYYNTLRTEGVATPIVRGMARDITERKHAEEALRVSEERYRELFENAKDAIYVHDLSGRYTSVNRAAEQLTGFSREQILGKHYSNFVLPRDLKHVRTNLCRKLDEENETIYQVDMVTRTGQRVPVEISSRLIYENGVAVGVQGTARDITDRKRAQEALRIYSQRLIQVQEAERENIARELHDEIGQVLTAVRINLQSMQRSSGLEENVPRLDESIGIVDEALGRVRELSIELRPSLLDDLGLTAALRWYVDRYARRTGIIAEVLDGFKEDGRLPRELETACFRIAQEALTNVARHAQAGSVSVQLERSRERMLLTVMDDGVGFDVDKLRKSASAAAALGLRGMEERALAVGGHIEIDSGLERGTRIRATFPLKRR